MVRPVGCRTKHLTEQERFRVRVLYYDACMTKKRIEEITGYSEGQIRTAIAAKSAQVGVRAGRPKRGSSGKQLQPTDKSTPSGTNENAQPSDLVRPQDDQQPITLDGPSESDKPDSPGHEVQARTLFEPARASTEQDNQPHSTGQSQIADPSASIGSIPLSNPI